MLVYYLLSIARFNLLFTFSSEFPLYVFQSSNLNLVSEALLLLKKLHVMFYKCYQVSYVLSLSLVVNVHITYGTMMSYIVISISYSTKLVPYVCKL